MLFSTLLINFLSLFVPKSQFPNPKSDFMLSCPIPINEYPRIVLAHGGGGRLMRNLVDKIFCEAFRNPILEEMNDGAVINLPGRRIAVTTDSYVVKPIFFPGGNIGDLAVDGTVNDLAMCGARPLYLTSGFIIEEGFEMEALWNIAITMRDAAVKSGVFIVTGDTKVVDRGKGDGVYINTAGVGIIEHNLVISPKKVRPGDAIILSGDIGRHGIAVMSAREGLQFETAIQSDCAPLNEPVMAMLNSGIEIRCMRDLTRGGLGSGLVEICETAGVGMELCEKRIPVLPEVSAACEIMGFDPLYVANEGRFIAIVPEKQAEQAVEIMRRYEVSSGAVVIGRACMDNPGMVSLITQYGTSRIVDMLSGEQLPRIC